MVLGEANEVLDALIVGAGPGGTAVAFRARELGFSALVIDYDDILKRIREYPKDKSILPDFGGGDRMRFPVGGALFARLHFAPIDKDEMVLLWKRHFQEGEVPVQVGVELLGLERRPDKVWNVRCWNHKAQAAANFLARHVVISIGRGVPRRFDIPGNTDGIAFRLQDAAAYVGSPACVIGGGTSAAEAVIAISNAKITAQDPTNVFWSYRGEKLPRVSKALAEVFFEAYIGNGNIRYHPKSEPTAVVVGEDRRDYLALRIDRKQLPNRPCESSHLEFLKESCIACIGEDIPEGLLNSMGIYMATASAEGKKRMLVTKHLETQLENVYLVGDILAQAYFETDDFNADPSTYREVAHRGNIKMALTDGYLVAEVIRRRLQNEPAGDIEIPFAAEAAGTPAIPATKAQPAAVDLAPAPVPLAVAPVESAGPPEKSLFEDRRVREDVAWLIRILPGDVQENEFALKPGEVTTIGRRGCDLSFVDDTLLSDRHASISAGADGYFLRDDGSATGVYLQAREAKTIELVPGDIVRLGRQFLVAWSKGDRRYLVHYDDQGNEKGHHELHEGAIVVGREADLSIDAGDLSLSRRHLAILVKDGRTFVRDLKSANGTYLKVANLVRLEHGDHFRVGQQLFVFSLKDNAVLDLGHRTAPRGTAVIPALAPAPAPARPVPTPAAAPLQSAARAAAPPPPAAAGGAPAAGGITVTFRDLDKTFTLKPGQSICDLAEEQGIEIDSSCHAGSCGADPVRIISGAEYLGPISSDERDAIEDICKLAPGAHRMACVLKPKGPVVIEVVRP